MIAFPDRLSPIVDRLVAGEPVTREDVDRIAMLQAIDLVAVGQEFARITCERNEQATKELFPGTAQ